MNIKDQIYNACMAAKEQVLNSFNKWQHDRYLKKRGWTEEEFQNYEDPDRDIRSSRVTDYYHGYQHIYSFTSTRTLPWIEFENWMDCYEEMNRWCKANCQGKFRSDILRAYSQTGIGLNGSTSKEWFINDIGGGDALFYAFKDSRDYTLFCLRWA